MAVHQLIKDCTTIFQAGVDAVSPLHLVQRAISRDGDMLLFRQSGMTVKLSHNVRVYGFGKAVIGMVAAVDELLGDHVADGLVSIPKGTITTMQANHPEFLPKQTSKITLAEGARHNLPDDDACTTGNEILTRLRNATEADIVILLISGGGSALLPVPVDGISLADKLATTTALASRSATIAELNTIRKHISNVKGGRLALAAVPAKLFTLILSDVIGDPLDVIASGPTVGDTTTFADCRRIFERFGTDGIPQSVLDYIRDGANGLKPDTPKPTDAVFNGEASVHNELVGTNKIAIAAAKQHAIGLGYTVFEFPRPLSGNAREEAQTLVTRLEELGQKGGRRCLIAGGETTCIVKGTGKGGRNQELALVAALTMQKKGFGNNAVLLSAGTDGEDGPTDVAGAFGDATLIERCHTAGLDPNVFLENNDSYNLFLGAGGLLKTGLTGTNVMDLVIALIDTPTK
eukprot:m.98793 g.98793  ORF g.98793 m.98793 type:complete len:461 (-) comp27097_c0_seq2:36-1418(-)